MTECVWKTKKNIKCFVTDFSDHIKKPAMDGIQEVLKEHGLFFDGQVTIYGWVYVLSKKKLSNEELIKISEEIMNKIHNV